MSGFREILQRFMFIGNEALHGRIPLEDDVLIPVVHVEEENVEVEIIPVQDNSTQQIMDFVQGNSTGVFDAYLETQRRKNDG